jgi:urea transport system ATP-binding protein
MSAAALEVRDLTAGYGGAMVLHGLNLAVRPGEIVALLGKNGMGKSTLLKTVMGLLPPRSGTVALFGEATGTLRAHQVARRPLAYAPQERGLFQDLSVEQNLRLGLRSAASFGERFEHVAAIFPVLATRLRQRAGTLSGGEQKMLLVARTLLAEPRLILIDEISEGLQPSVVERLAAVLNAERERCATAMLIVEQNVAFALAIADRYLVLKRGEIVDAGAVDAPQTAAHVAAQLGV